MVAFRVIHFQIVFNFLHWILYTVQVIYSVEVKYLGCYIDDDNRMLDDKHLHVWMTLEKCKLSCYNHRYLGLQVSVQCFCGDSLGDPFVYNKTSDTECYQKCSGNWSQICGGPWRNSVYEFITATVPTTEMTTPVHCTGQSTVKTTKQTTLGQSDLTSTEMTKPRKSTKTTLQITKHGPFKVTEITTKGQPKVTTTDMAIPGESSVTYTHISKNGASKVTTTEITTLGQLLMTTTDMKLAGKLSETTLQVRKPNALKVTTTNMKVSGQLSLTTSQVTEPRASEVATIKTTGTFGKSEVNSVQQITPLECLCPCSNVVKGKWDFLRGTNLTLDQLREVMKPDLFLMTKELSINKSNTTRMKRSKMSAPDDRGSAKSVGYVAVVFICFIAVLIVFFDIRGCFEAKFKRRS